MFLFLDYMLLQRKVMENNNRECSCNDKTKTLPFVIITSVRADCCDR